MATFSKTYFSKALLNFQFHSSIIYDIVSLGKKGILTYRDSGLLEPVSSAGRLKTAPAADFVVRRSHLWRCREKSNESDCIG